MSILPRAPQDTAPRPPLRSHSLHFVCGTCRIVFAHFFDMFGIHV